ncbi:MULTISPECIES: SUMF1/EgtB/PvdO family nonheme iron enzyme [unclassified Oceanispirochaeta]|uniref:SUMF1/EgtB/PvdO family nonheme iron enzyme n=1 Tax=unclassified Oceanispirochaeta TaxID=2635722 RepID=UPI001313F155|nr:MULTISPECIES: SUMF1/EgtB/PvdO family nonheme iron enzyme [unclassified Oceanispirochaeta]MBF9018275.1 SUMF1/EgtB/PvdO family nonheme iron enzyme [Oceanispirochaeta sp. M2]NPD74740.1 SUMF1/EgtB/PvdO family nonheme iron enzyme [Oceanispirochaeta sp. M1]
MKQKIFGLLLVLSTVLVLTGCPNDTKPLSNNADLSALTVNIGSLSPVFAADTTAYTVSVPNGTSSITVTGIQADHTATLSTNNGVSLDLTVGDNPIILTVTAADGSTQDYVVTVSVTAAGTSADLSALTVSTGSLIPAFAADTTAYTVSVPNGTSSIAVTGVQADTTAVLSANNGVSQDLTEGDNPIILTVTAADGITAKDYVVMVGTDYYSSNIGILMYVPAGTFQRDGVSAENTSTVSAFRMSEKEITRDQFRAIMGAEPSNTTYSNGTTDPVQIVNWYHAIAFCNKLSIAEGLTLAYEVPGVTFSTLTYGNIPTSRDDDWDLASANWTNTGYRLPTEMEWMWAAMGASSDSIGGDIVDGVNTGGHAKAFAGSDGSNAIGDYAWYNSNSGDKSHPAGARVSNELGLDDMSGNVFEWCWDWFGTYPTGDETDYKGATSGTSRVIRGGGWHNNAPNCAVAYRCGYEPNRQIIDVGFRVVRP